jgi:predicted RNase H-like HicB family nuclease
MRELTLEYWEDDGWLVGRLKEFPSVMSQGETFDDLKANIREAYKLVVDDAAAGAGAPPERKEAAIAL